MKTESDSTVQHRSGGIFTCPRCGKGKLFKGFISISDRCVVCGLSLGQHEQGDGPAYVAILFVGTLTGVLATIVEVKYEPSFWFHLAVWPLFILTSSLLCLRWAKAALVAAQYRVRKEDFDTLG